MRSYSRFGLEIGRTVNGKETASETECVLFPRPSFFSKTKNAPALANEPFDGSIVQSVPVSENAPVEIHKPSRRERREASAERAKKKAELVHSFRTTFGTTSILTFASRRRAKPWVPSSTSSTTSTMTQVKDDHIKREDTLKMFYDIPNIRTTIAVRQPTVLQWKSSQEGMILLQTFQPDSWIGLSMLKMLQFGRKELIRSCMLDPQRELPARPNWGSRDSSDRGANSQSNSSSQRREQSGPRGKKEQADDHHPGRASREEEPTSRWDSFGVLGLGLDATEMEVKTAYRMLALQNHPDKIDLNELA
ncbi:hypothetical protein THAOC_30567 [Thalassiosira oceanica]|uniref:J domain-containing protein n=1 Tax=Thalassiosira oceanica TaxID=159749 RepID=K0RA00_THAOC|nr:hypothetical protein THAOC_30567 [Thalassiosira oceanica]|eukprot:EJK50458.1 hypothetical protein THAOC_30567 [Thalassiosira oceanica]